MRDPFAVLPVASALHDPATLDRLLADHLPGLAARGGQRVSAPDDLAGVPVVVFVLTGGTERAVLDLRARLEQDAPGEPTWLVTHPAHNSLPAALETLARIRQDGGSGRILHLRGPDDAAGLDAVADAVHDLVVDRLLRRARVGLVGPPSDWLVASSPPPAAVQRAWGPTVVPVAMDTVVSRARAVPAAAAAPLALSVAGGATASVEPDAPAVADASRVHPALRALVEDERLDAITVRCFDLLSSLHTSGCVALAELNDAGITAGCEGDLPSTIGMLWVRLLVGSASWMANPAHVDVDANLVRLAHCTIARSLVGSYSLRSHFESGIGVGIHGELPLGPVTVLRIGGVGLERLWTADGEVVRSGDDEDVCRTQADIVLARRPVGDLLDAPLGNHLVVVPGHHAARLDRWWELFVAPRVGGAGASRSASPAVNAT